MMLNACYLLSWPVYLGVVWDMSDGQTGVNILYVRDTKNKIGLNTYQSHINKTQVNFDIIRATI